MPAQPIDKNAVLDALRARVEKRLADVRTAQRDAQAGATHTEARPEHPKDTRAIEGSYLARGLAERVEALHDAVAVLRAIAPTAFGEHDAIALTALVGLHDENDEQSVYFLAPAGGGERLDIDGTAVLVITPHAPLGQALVGRRVGDEIALPLPGRRLDVVVAWIA